MFPNYQTRVTLIAAHFIEPMFDWALAPADLASNDDRRKKYVGWLGEDINAELPSDMTADEIKLMCQKAFRDLRLSQDKRFWPENKRVVDAFRGVLSLRPKPKAKTAIEGPGGISERLRAWIDEQDTDALILNANHYRRRYESTVGTKVDQLIAQVIENEIARRKEQAQKPVEDETLSETIDRYRRNNQHRNFADMSDAELLERWHRYQAFKLEDQKRTKVSGRFVDTVSLQATLSVDIKREIDRRGLSVRAA